MSRHICKSCAKAKITRRSFHPSDPYTQQVSKYLEKVPADIAIYLNCPSRQGYKCVFVITDVATKVIWELKTRTAEEVLSCVKLVSTLLPMYPGSHQLLHYHADGGAELIRSYLLLTFETTFTWSFTATPELKSISERMFRTISEMPAMLTESGVPKSFWWDAYVTSCDIVRMMPTRTCRGRMSPAECVPGGQVQNLSRLR